MTNRMFLSNVLPQPSLASPQVAHEVRLTVLDDDERDRRRLGVRAHPWPTFGRCIVDPAVLQVDGPSSRADRLRRLRPSRGPPFQQAQRRRAGACEDVPWSSSCWTTDTAVRPSGSSTLGVRLVVSQKAGGGRFCDSPAARSGVGTVGAGVTRMAMLSTPAGEHEYCPRVAAGDEQQHQHGTPRTRCRTGRSPGARPCFAESVNTAAMRIAYTDTSWWCPARTSRARCRGAVRDHLDQGARGHRAQEQHGEEEQPRSRKPSRTGRSSTSPSCSRTTPMNHRNAMPAKGTRLTTYTIAHRPEVVHRLEGVVGHGDPQHHQRRDEQHREDDARDRGGVGCAIVGPSAPDSGRGTGVHARGGAVRVGRAARRPVPGRPLDRRPGVRQVDGSVGRTRRARRRRRVIRSRDPSSATSTSPSNAGTELRNRHSASSAATTRRARRRRRPPG